MSKKLANYISKYIVIFGILAAILILFYPLLFGKSLVENGMVFSDFWQFNYPLKDFYKSEIASGRLGLWSSYLGNGYPVFAEGQTGVLYPINFLLFYIFPTSLAFNLDIIIHFLFAFLFTYLFARISLRLTKPAAFLAGMCYSLSGYFFIHLMFINIINVVAYLPLLFLFTEQLTNKPKFLWILPLGLVISLIVLAGHLELAYYVIFSTGLFFLLLTFISGTKEGNKAPFSKKVTIFAISGILAIGICAAQVLPTYELYKSSNRNVSYDIQYVTSSRWPLKALWMFVNPSMLNKFNQRVVNTLDQDNFAANSLYGYVGILPLVFAIIAFIKKRTRYTVIFSIMLVLAFLYGIGRSTSFFSIVWSLVPGMKSLRFPVKILFLIEFCLAVLAGIGFDYVKELVSKKGVKVVHLLSLAVILISFADIYFNNYSRIVDFLDVNAWTGIPASGEYLREHLENSNYRYFSTNTSNLYQKSFNFNTQKSFQNLMPVDFNLLYKLPSNREYFTLFDYRNEKLNGYNAVPDFQSQKLIYPDEFYKSLAVQSVKYILTDFALDSDKVQRVNGFPFSGEAVHRFDLKTTDLKVELVPVSAVYVYELMNPVPRVNFVTDYLIANSDEEAFQKVVAKDFDPLRQVVLELPSNHFEYKNKEAGVISDLKSTKISKVEDKQDSIYIEIENSYPGIIVLTDSYYPGWKVFVDGQEGEILKANYGFRAVQLAKGSHNVVFKYEPESFQQGKRISLLGLGSFFVISLFVVAGTLRTRKNIA